MSSGLDALRIALIAAGLEQGEEVIVPAMTFVATLEAVTQAGGVPVVADIQEDDLNLDPDAAAAAATGRTRFVLPVHLYGQLADMGRLGSLGLPLIEDACQAPGAVRDGLRAGTGGLAAAFSFYPAKNLGAMGDAGAIVTDERRACATAAARCASTGSGGSTSTRRRGSPRGLTPFRPIVLLRKLPLLERWNDERRKIATPVPRSAGGCRRSPPSSGSSGQRARLAPLRRSDGQPGPARRTPGRTRRPVGPPLSRSRFISPRRTRTSGWPKEASPWPKHLARQCLSLPIFPGMREDEVEHVVAAVKAFFGDG